MQKYNVATSGAFIEEFILPPYNSGTLSNLNFAVKDGIDLKDKVTEFGNPTSPPKAVANAVCVEQLTLIRCNLYG